MADIISFYSTIINKFHNQDEFCNKMKNVFTNRKTKIKIYKKLFVVLMNNETLEMKFIHIIYRFNTHGIDNLKNNEIEFALKELSNAYDSVLEDELEEEFNKMDIEEDDLDELNELFKNM